MSRERQFFVDREDAYTHSAFAVHRLIPRDHERRLRKIGFFRYALHLIVAHTASVSEYSQLVALERAGREHIELYEG
jgi:hypothetical protein